VVTASDDQTARVWDAVTGTPVTPPLEHHGPVQVAAWSPDGTRVVTAGFDHTARVWTLPIDTGSVEDWRVLARCSPFALVNGVLTTNPDPLRVCPRHHDRAMAANLGNGLPPTSAESSSGRSLTMADPPSTRGRLAMRRVRDGHRARRR